MASTSRRRNRLLTGLLPSPKCALEWTTLATGHSNRLTSRPIRSMPWSLVVNIIKHRWDATSGRVCWRVAPCRWTATGRVSMPTPWVTSRSGSASSPTTRMIATQSTPSSGSAAAETPALETGPTTEGMLATGTPTPLVISWCSSQGERFGLSFDGPALIQVGSFWRDVIVTIVVIITSGNYFKEVTCPVDIVLLWLS